MMVGYAARCFLRSLSVLSQRCSMALDVQSRSQVLTQALIASLDFTRGLGVNANHAKFATRMLIKHLLAVRQAACLTGQCANAGRDILEMALLTVDVHLANQEHTKTDQDARFVLLEVFPRKVPLVDIRATAIWGMLRLGICALPVNLVITKM